MKLQDNLISNQTELINDNKEIREKLNLIEAKFNDLKKENETLQSKFMIVEKTSTTLSTNHKKFKTTESLKWKGTRTDLSNIHVSNALKLLEYRTPSQTTFPKNTSF